MGGKSDPPPAPDYVGAAQQTAAGNLDAAKYATEANRVNQFTPYGSSVYKKGTDPVFDQAGYDAALAAYNANPGTAGTQGTWVPGQAAGPGRWVGGGEGGDRYEPGAPATEGYYTGGTPGSGLQRPTREQFTTPGNPDSWSQTVSLSPAQQALYDKDLAIKGGLSDVATRGLGYVQNMLDTPFDTSKLAPEAVNPGETAQAAILRRIQPQLDRDRGALRTQLVNQGLTEGSEAYNTAMERADAQANDAYSQAALQGINVGQQARQQGIQEQSFLRNEPINTLNAVRSGSQVQAPTFGAIPQQATTAGPDILGATNMGYQAQVANTNAQNASGANFWNGAFGLGSAALPFAFSDERLKTNIRQVGALPNGIGIYVFAYKDNPEALMLGCIAQDVEIIMPQAVRTDSHGYKMVNYPMVLK